jgi:transposase
LARYPNRGDSGDAMPTAKAGCKHLEGIVAWAQTRQTNGFLEAMNGLYQAAKRRAQGFTRMSTIRTVIFLIAGKLDFRVVNLHVS